MHPKTLFHALGHAKGGSVVSLDTLTKVRLSGGKSNPQQGHIFKRTIGARAMIFNGMHTSAFEAIIKKRLVEEGKSPAFVVGPRTWGMRIENTPFITHEGKYYLETFVLEEGDISYLFDGTEIDEFHIQGLPPKSSPVGQGGLSNSVIIRTYAFAAITRLHVAGRVYQGKEFVRAVTDWGDL